MKSISQVLQRAPQAKQDKYSICDEKMFKTIFIEDIENFNENMNVLNFNKESLNCTL